MEILKIAFYLSGTVAFLTVLAAMLKATGRLNFSIKNPTIDKIDPRKRLIVRIAPSTDQILPVHAKNDALNGVLWTHVSVTFIDGTPVQHLEASNFYVERLIMFNKYNVYGFLREEFVNTEVRGLYLLAINIPSEMGSLPSEGGYWSRETHTIVVEVIYNEFMGRDVKSLDFTHFGR